MCTIEYANGVQLGGIIWNVFLETNDIPTHLSSFIRLSL